MVTTPRRAAVYLRVSLDATGEGLAVDRQREACLSIVAARGWQLVDEYVDNSISATDAKKNRPGYNRLTADLEAGRFDALVCYDLDRLTRQPRQLEDWIDAADRDALALVTANGEADLTTDAGRLFARIKLAVARSEVERKSVRQRDAAKQRSELGRPPLGVRLTGYTPQGDLVPDEAEAVRQMFDRLANGEPLRAIARTLTEAGVTTRRGRPWHPSTIRTILTNPRYAGRAVYQGQETGKPGGWVPIVADAQYDAVQALLRDHGRRTQTTTERRHLGSGLYLCGAQDERGESCDEPLSSWSGGRYRCRAGGHVTRAQGPVDEYVESELRRKRLSDPRLRAALASGTADTEPYLSEIDRQKRLLRRAESDYQAELIDGPLYKSTRDAARRALREAEDGLAGLTRTSASSSVLTAADPVAAYDDADLMTRRAVIDALAIVWLLPGHRYSRTFDPETVIIYWRTS
jgi:site-specific DNA recombinase